jgi:hypothetical protein
MIEVGTIKDKYKQNTIIFEKKISHITKNEHIKKLFDIGKIISKHINSMAWVICQNQTKDHFITSDNPAIVTSIKKLQKKSLTPIKTIEWLFTLKGIIEWETNKQPNKDINIILPLSPKLCLLCAHQNNESKYENRLTITNPATIESFIIHSS